MSSSIFCIFLNTKNRTFLKKQTFLWVTDLTFLLLQLFFNFPPVCHLPFNCAHDSFSQTKMYVLETFIKLHLEWFPFRNDFGVRVTLVFQWLAVYPVTHFWSMNAFMVLPTKFWYYLLNSYTIGSILDFLLHATSLSVPMPVFAILNIATI